MISQSRARMHRRSLPVSLLFSVVVTLVLSGCGQEIAGSNTTYTLRPRVLANAAPNFTMLEVRVIGSVWIVPDMNATGGLDVGVTTVPDTKPAPYASPEESSMFFLDGVDLSRSIESVLTVIESRQNLYKAEPYIVDLDDDGVLDLVGRWGRLGVFFGPLAEVYDETEADLLVGTQKNYSFINGLGFGSGEDGSCRVIWGTVSSYLWEVRSLNCSDLLDLAPRALDTDVPVVLETNRQVFSTEVCAIPVGDTVFDVYGVGGGKVRIGDVDSGRWRELLNERGDSPSGHFACLNTPHGQMGVIGVPTLDAHGQLDVGGVVILDDVPADATRLEDLAVLQADPSARYFGYSLFSVGDLNNDGFDDLGIPFRSYEREDEIVHIFLGPITKDTDLTQPDVKIETTNPERRSRKFVGAGDITGDGLPDLLQYNEKEIYLIDGSDIVEPR